MGNCEEKEALLLQQTAQDALAVGEEEAGDLVAVGLLVGDGMDGAVVEGEDGGARKAQQNGRMGDDKKLSPGLGAGVDFPKKRQLPLGGQGRLRLVQEINPAAPEVVLDRG